MHYESQPGGRECFWVSSDGFLCPVKCMVPSEMESYHLAVVGSQKQWQEPVLFWVTLGPHWPVPGTDNLILITHIFWRHHYYWGTSVQISLKLYFILLCLVIISIKSVLLRNRKGVDLDERGGGEELRGVEGGETRESRLRENRKCSYL